MKYIKTVKHFVSGSDKFFDIFECTIDEVDVHRDAKGRKSLSVKVGETWYKGLWNKSVQDHLTENEGKQSFIVLWKSPKGNHMLAYSWKLWRDHIDGDSSGEVTSQLPTAAARTGEAFLYMWIDLKTDRKYIGFHKGTLDDGYICSGQLMLDKYNAEPDRFIRTILAWGSREEMHTLETLLLLQLGAAGSDNFYNVSNNLRA